MHMRPSFLFEHARSKQYSLPASTASQSPTIQDNPFPSSDARSSIRRARHAPFEQFLISNVICFVRTPGRILVKNCGPLCVLTIPKPSNPVLRALNWREPGSHSETLASTAPYPIHPKPSLSSAQPRGISGDGNTR